ncbi:hypothetical protein ABZ281_06540 [Streptomyces sp. NPDC006265]|uniref:hypothetical protein n=1 Tax=Streptomyces sp. NPDC006265 TaxID=3156740 RepID=UPI0033BB639A
MGGHLRHLAPLSVAGGVSTTVDTAASDPSTSPATTPPSASARATAHVTPVTGDTVNVDGTGRVIDVRRGKGREHIGFSMRSFTGHTYVVPRLLGSGRPDRRLFDVTGLIKDKYDDAHRRQLPLIVAHKGGSRSQDTARHTLAATTDWP